MNPLPLVWISAAFAGPNTALVGLEHAQGEGALRQAVAALGGTTRFCYPLARLCAADFSGPPPLAALRALPGARYAVRDEIMPLTPAASWTDALGTADCDDLWELELLEADAVWALADGSGALPVAIEDSGFLLTHEELSGTSAFAWDYGDGNSSVEVVTGVSVPGHGTFIAGMIGAIGDNDLGRAGLAPGGQLAYQKIADRTSALYYSYAIDAMAELADGDAGGARVLSYSLAGSSVYAPFEDAVEGLGDAGVLLVAAAANCSTAWCSDADNDRYPQYPASYDGDFILSVAGSLEDDSLNPYSHYGLTSVDLAAPGADLCSLGIDSTGDYETESGTSYATPIVAAAAALVWELHPDLSAEEVAFLMVATAEPSLDLADRVASGGRLDVLDALLAPLPGLGEPASTVTLDPSGNLSVDVETRAAAAEIVLLLLHDASVRVTDAGEGSITRVEAGESLSVGGEDYTLDQTATLITGDLAAHEAATLTLTVEATATGNTDATLRLVEEGPSGVVLGAPLDDGEEDATGELAYALRFTATEAVEDTGTDTGDSGTDTADSGETADTDDSTGGDDTTDETGAVDIDDILDTGKEPEGCACNSSRSPSMGWTVLLLGLVLRRRALRWE